ncbi:flagellin [Roseomonas populi]|uniref:Flagellin n=1 Tax=Roseomonas populi TaxID=3121582 RepID=A0ABT1WYG5_9PROT|nr:flagellin [Roseomonas pecuniae]MCR0980887.1 flagellin [Roseomonas pecuniae]
MAVTGIGSGALARLVQQSSVIKAQLTTLAAQSADGKRGTWYGDFSGEAARAISLRGEITRRETHTTAIDRALGTTAAAQDALAQLSSIAESFLAEAGKVTTADSTRITALASGAHDAIQQVAALLNERQAGGYLFGGADTANPPIPDPAGIMSTTMATGIAAAVSSLAPGNGAAVLSGTLAAAASTNPGETPFSDYALDPLKGGAEPRPTTLTGDGEAVGTGLFASRNATGPTTGSETGSWSRDLLRGLMTLASLTAGQAAAGADFDAVMTGVKASLESAMTGLGEEAGALGLSESRLEAARTRHEDMGLALKSQLSDVEEVDLATTLTALQDTQTRLQASWQALSMLSGLSLTKFL